MIYNECDIIRIKGHGGKHFNINKYKYQTELPKLFPQHFHTVFIKPIIKNKEDRENKEDKEDTGNINIRDRDTREYNEEDEIDYLS